MASTPSRLEGGAEDGGDGVRRTASRLEGARKGGDGAASSVPERELSSATSCTAAPSRRHFTPPAAAPPCRRPTTPATAPLHPTDFVRRRSTAAAYYCSHVRLLVLVFIVVGVGHG
uniref:Uncharacterized protein n=1 Tax=Oryza meridionalis TaxID=40149 RepID=A0A0E0DZG1_9ORYZ